MSDNLDFALSYAALGWHVHPCKPDKKPYTKWGSTATTDAAKIRSWWKRWPDALIGIACEKSGMWALDVDNKNGVNGRAEFKRLIDDHGGGEYPPVGPVQRTPSGGAHFLFKLTEGINIPNNAGQLAPGLDLRSRGYICSGGAYQWQDDHGPDTYLVEAPSWVLDLISNLESEPIGSLLPANEAPARLIDTTDSGEYWLNKALAQTAPGQRDNDAFWLACQLRDHGLTQAAAEPYMRNYARSCPQYPGNKDPFTESDAIDSMVSAYTGTARGPAVNADKRTKSMDKSTAEKPPEQTSAQDAGNSAASSAQNEPEAPPLPDYAKLGDMPGNGANKWLDDYIEFSRLWSPRAYDAFHEACGLWLLSTIAARRVAANMGKRRYTNIYIAMVARSSLHAKSTTADIAMQALHAAGMGWLLAADCATPQKFIQDLTVRIPDNFDELEPEQQERIRKRLACSAQRGWFYDEFGMHISSMMRTGGSQADSRGLLRRFDDTPQRYEYGSIGRGDDIVERPYLALLASLTPADLRPFAGKGDALWGDGFLARFALITPPNTERSRARFPKGERIIPANIITPLHEWSQRLGLPGVSITDLITGEGKTTGKRAIITPSEAQVIEVDADTQDAFYLYDEALLDIVENYDEQDLDANYARFSEKALRVSLLLASLAGSDSVKLHHFARAQAITERWRNCLHELYNQLNEPPESAERANEERVLRTIKRLNPTERELNQRHRMGRDEIKRIITSLIDAGEIVEQVSGKTKKYKLWTPEA